MTATAAIAATTHRLRKHVDARGSRTQLTVIGAQMLAGVGNLLVSLIAARLLDPGGYADVVTFLALYLAVHVPAAALTASAAVDPDRAEIWRRRAIPLGVAAGVLVVAASPILSAATGLPVAMVLVLALALPGAAGLGIARGRAYALHDVRAITASLLAEPITRAGAGVALMWRFGATGGALAAVLGGYLAWALCAGGATPASDLSRGAHPADPARAAVARGVGLSFVGLAVLQVTDLVIANARLAEVDAARFGALSTIGGAAVFATATVPFVLLPESARGNDDARRFAAAAALAIGLGIAVVGGLWATPLLGLVAGDELADAAPSLAPYLLAMTAIGVTRVLVATKWTSGDGRYAITALSVAVVAQIVGQLTIATTVAEITIVTLAVTLALALALTYAPTPNTFERPSGNVIDRLVGVGEPGARRTLGLRTETVALAALCAVATCLRVLSTRGLWVDEAISVRQAQMSFGAMLSDLRTSDVHPPLHHALLWVTVRIAGTSELAVRLPSLIAGVALVPTLLWVGRIVYDRRTGWLAAAFATIAPFLVWYSQEARMYTLFMLLAAVAVGAQVQAIRRGRRGDWLLVAASSAALLWTQYFALLPLLVQQVAFATVALRRHRRDRAEGRQFARDWVTATGLLVAMSLPLLPILHDQFVAYTNRSSGLVPGQAGAASSAIGGAISIYAVGANLIWGLWGYHADGTMVQLTALWPLLMLLVLVLLGRGRSNRTVLLAALVAVPLAALFVVGAQKRDLFELRYFSGAVPIALLLAARLVAILARARRVFVVASTVALATLAAGLVDQQLNGANPRLYDFEGALAHVGQTDDHEVLVYEPSYLGDVIDYYAPDLDSRPLGTPIPDDASTVWVLATENVLSDEAASGRVGAVLADLEETRGDARVLRRPNVRVWELP